ncbi:MAG: methyltransferase [candidate division WOR-3 bacterium]
MHIAVFISGFGAVISQTMIMREMLAFFSGNELISGIILFLWLLWTGLGSVIYAKIKFKSKPEENYTILLFILCLALLFSFIFIRCAPRLLSLPFGEVTGFHKIILISLIALCPPCSIIGALFPAASTILKPSKVYLIESLGSFIGGIILSFLLINILPPSGNFILLISMLLFAGYACLEKRIILIISILPLFLFVIINKIEIQLKKAQMPGQNLIGVHESKYGNIAITKSESQINFYTNGVFDFAYPDIYSSEEAVHYPLLIHKNPQNVLLVGGGMGGSIEQILKHPSIKRLVYLELDPKIIGLAKRYTTAKVADERVTIIVGDGRFYIKKTKQNFDCIIINLPDPINAQLNRYYTLEFFQEAKRRLNQNGLFCIRVNYTPDILSPIYSQFLYTIKNTLTHVFENVYILPVAKATYIAVDYKLQENIRAILKKNLISRKLNLLYVNESFFDYNLTEEKIDYVKKSIERTIPYLNTDLKPICYYFNGLLWGSIVSAGLKKLFIKVFNLPARLFFLLLIPILFFWHRKTIVYLSVFTMGATGISTEIILIILFQVFYGYVYNWLGIIIGLFMLGLALGTLWFINIEKCDKLLNTSQKKMCWLSTIQFFLGIYLTVIILLASTKIFCTNYAIALLILLGGFLGGIHFPLSLEIVGSRNAGILYGIDLFGASLSAIITAIIFIPILGIINTLLIFIMGNLIVSLGIFKNRF